MTPIEVLAAVAVAAAAAVIFGAAGAAGGFLLSKSELFGDAQQRWNRNADMLDAALHGELVDWEEQWQAVPDPAVSPIPWGMIDGDTRVIPELVVEPGRRQRARWRTKWAWYAMLRCNICSGWHVIEALMVWTGVGLWALGVPALPILVAAPAVWLAAGWVHTRWSADANAKEIW